MSFHASYNMHKATPHEVVTTSVKLIAMTAPPTPEATGSHEMATLMRRKNVQCPDLTLQLGAATVLQYTVNNPYSLSSPVRMVLKVIPAAPGSIIPHTELPDDDHCQQKADSPIQFSCLEREGGDKESHDEMHSTTEGLTDTSMNGSISSQEILSSPRGVSKSHGSNSPITAWSGRKITADVPLGHCFTVVALFRSPLVFPLPVMYGKDCAKELAGLPRLRIGGVCCEAHPLTVVNIIFEITGITVAGADMFTNNKACCSVWARSDEDALKIFEAINKRVWMGPYNDGCAFRAESESAAQFFHECLTQSLVPGKMYHFPKHFMTVSIWTTSPPAAAASGKKVSRGRRHAPRKL